jgi:hypothetical protein
MFNCQTGRFMTREHTPIRNNQEDTDQYWRQWPGRLNYDKTLEWLLVRRKEVVPVLFRNSLMLIYSLGDVTQIATMDREFGIFSRHQFLCDMIHVLSAEEHMIRRGNRQSRYRVSRSVVVTISSIGEKRPLCAKPLSGHSRSNIDGASFVSNLQGIIRFKENETQY